MKVAVDTGGTFTDVIFLENGVLKARKVFSTPKEPYQAILNGIKGLPLGVLVHGSTVGTNAFLERKGAEVCFITTSGFEDIFFIGRQARPKLYDFFVEKPLPVIKEENVIGARERIDSEGKVLFPLEKSEVKALQERVKILKEKGVNSVAVCFLHSYLNPSHEYMVKESLEKLGLPVSISFEILPEFREYERASTTIINAYLSPVMGNYIGILKEKLKGVVIYIQQSSGGWLSADEAGKFACHTILSGPAGGVYGAFVWAKSLGINKIITFDMGGTSTDVCLVDGRIPFTKEYVIDGYPLSIPVIDIHTVGAGGGSIAWIDRGGALKVGPQSAGADPGPACYGKSFLPTVTDANLVLGRLLPDKFLGGTHTLQKDRSEKAIYSIAKELQTDIEKTALGIISIANVNMGRALRKVSLERGFDPRDFALFCFGGAGGLHACELAKELNIKTVVIPKLASSLSAFGLFFAPPLKDFSRTVWINAKDKEKLLSALQDLKKQAESYLKSSGLSKEDFIEEVFLDMRYKGQGFELSIPFSEDYITAFEKEHEKQFSYTYSECDIEIVTLRFRLKGKELMASWRLEMNSKSAETFTTKIFTEKGWIEVEVVEWDELKEGDKLSGPLLITEKFTTVWIPAGFKGEVRENLTLVLRQ